MTERSDPKNVKDILKNMAKGEMQELDKTIALVRHLGECACQDVERRDKLDKAIAQLSDMCQHTTEEAVSHVSFTEKPLIIAAQLAALQRDSAALDLRIMARTLEQQMILTAQIAMNFQVLLSSIAKVGMEEENNG